MLSEHPLAPPFQQCVLACVAVSVCSCLCLCALVKQFVRLHNIVRALLKVSLQEKPLFCKEPFL